MFSTLSIERWATDPQHPLTGNLEELIQHGLHALRETLQQDKELTIKNTSVGIVGPAGVHETNVSEEGSFRILEGDAVNPHIQALPAKEAPGAPVPAAGAADAAAADEDVQMAG